jgi:hypothetical protein
VSSPAAGVVCACGETFTERGIARHRKGCAAYRAAARAPKAPPTRPQEHRELASELREAIVDNDKAQERLRAAEAAVVSARDYAARTAADLAEWRLKAAAIGLAGDDAATVESVRAWVRATPATTALLARGLVTTTGDGENGVVSLTAAGRAAVEK